MWIDDAIEWDEGAIEDLTEKGLTKQLLLHELMKRKKMKHQIDAAKLQAKIVAEVQVMIDQLASNPMTQVISQIVASHLKDYVDAGDYL